MARWFWYVSTTKISSLKRPAKGWSLLRQRLRTAELQAGVPWAKLSTHGLPDTSVIESLESVEREIQRDHGLPATDEIASHDPVPLFLQFEGYAGRLILRESYKGNEGECVLLVAGTQGRTGVLLLGSGSHVVGSTAPRPRMVNPSIDPVGALLVLLDRQAFNTGFTRAGIARDADDLSPEECVSYSFSAALEEIQRSSFTYRVRALLVASVVTPYRRPGLIQRVGDPGFDRVIVGSPIYVEQLDAG
jgi:hypothetical protein